MAGDPPRTGRPLALARTTVKFALAWVAVHMLRRLHGPSDPLDRLVRALLHYVTGAFPSLAAYVDSFYDTTVDVLWGGGLRLVSISTVLAILGALARMVARARVRAKQGDFLERPRAWLAANPSQRSLLYVLPGLLWTLSALWPGPWYRAHLGYWISDCLFAAPSLALAVWASSVLLKKGTRELLAPTMEGEAAEQRFAIGTDEISFDAVAVTPRSIAIVALFTAIMAAVPAVIWTRTITELLGEAGVFSLFVGYVVLAIAGAVAFRRASRVSVGVDGVHVRGTSRARFVAYRDIDSARAHGADLELVSGGVVVLRLQLHGEDAARRDAVLARITENIERIREGRRAAAAQIVAAASHDDLARAAGGGASYRAATLTREQLWALVEGPEIDAGARKAAAGALVHSSDGAERARLRVAAEQCAEPDVRVALLSIAEEDEGGGEGASPAARSSAGT